MTEIELRTKIRDIRSERNRLRNELQGYEQQLAEIEYESEMVERRESIGKCYIVTTDIDRDWEEIKAFKIISIPEQTGGLTHANCVIVTENGVDMDMLGLWSYANMQKIVHDPTLVVDACVEISQEEFNEILNEEITRLTEIANGSSCE